MTITDNATRVLIEPENPAESCVIWLHGLGADGHDFTSIVPEFRLPSTRFIFPHAPMRPITINGGMVMRGWYDITGFELADKEDLAGINDSADLVQTLITEQIEQGIPADKIVIAGFSQGGAIALYAGLRYNAPLAGILALSTYLPGSRDLAEERHLANNTTPILMMHGLFDTVIPSQVGAVSRDVLLAHQYNVDWKTYSMAHQLCAPQIVDINQWLKDLVY